jgi:hypothetical protein
MRAVPWLVFAALFAGCPLDPDWTVDWSLRPDASTVLDLAGCSTEPLDEDGVFYDGTCSPVLHPQDQPSHQWEEYGVYEFDVEPMTLFGGTVYELWFAAHGREYERAIGLAMLDDGVTVQRHAANPVFVPVSGRTTSQLLCTAHETGGGPLHLWFRDEAGDLFHTRATDALTWEGGVLVSGLYSDALTEVFSCDAWFDDDEVRMLVGGRMNGEYALGETRSEDGVHFDPVTEPAFEVDSASPWQSEGIGFPSRIVHAGVEYLFYIGTSEWSSESALTPVPRSPAIGLAIRRDPEQGFEQFLVNPVPMAEDAAPGRVRAAVAGEWAMLYFRDEYEGTIIDGYSPHGLGQMAVWLPGLEEGS